MSNKSQRHPLQWVPTVYFAMGLPLILLGQVAPVMFKDFGIADEEITRWISLITLPWALKPLLSLVLETFGTKRNYVILTELLSSLVLGLIVFALPLSNFFAISIALMGVIAIAGSSHDIAGDGIYLSELDKETQSQYSGWQGAFYNMAKVLSNGALVYLAGWLVRSQNFTITLSWQVILGINALILLFIGLYHSIVLPREERKEGAEEKKTFAEQSKTLVEVFVSFFQKKHIWIWILFIFLYRLPEGMAAKLFPLFLKAETAVGGLGMTNEVYGEIYGTYGTVAFILGSIVAGYYVAHFGLKKVLFSLAVVFNIQFLVYMLFAVYRPESHLWQSVGIVGEYFGYGFGFVGLIVFMMQVVAPGKYQMAHYAFANSIGHLATVVFGLASAELIKYVNNNYETFFIVCLVLVVPTLLITPFIPFGKEETTQQ